MGEVCKKCGNMGHMTRYHDALSRRLGGSREDIVMTGGDGHGRKREAQDEGGEAADGGEAEEKKTTAATTKKPAAPGEGKSSTAKRRRKLREKQQQQTTETAPTNPSSASEYLQNEPQDQLVSSGDARSQQAEGDHGPNENAPPPPTHSVVRSEQE